MIDIKDFEKKILDKRIATDKSMLWFYNLSLIVGVVIFFYSISLISKAILNWETNLIGVSIFLLFIDLIMISMANAAWIKYDSKLHQIKTVWKY